MGARVLVRWWLVVFSSATALGCGILLAGAGDDDEPTTTSPPSNGDGGVLEATFVDGPANGGDDGGVTGDETNTGKPGVDAGGGSCPQCASGHCPSGPTLCDPLVFVTAEDFAGGIDEVADASGADKLDVACNRSAAIAGIKGYYKAWISVDGEGPAQRLAQTQRPYRRRDGNVVVPNFDGFRRITGLDSRISLTAGGAAVNAARVWTGTRHDLSTEQRNCVDWSSSLSTGEQGVAGLTTCPPPPDICPPDHWTFRTTESCSVRARIYCIEQVP